VCVRSVDAAGGELRELYAASYARLVGVLTLAAASREEAEEVVQEAFVQLIPRWNTVRAYDDPEAWVRRVAFRRLSNRRRTSRVAARTLSVLRRAPNAPAVSGDRVDVVRALAVLPVAQRQVLVLHHLLDFPVERVAAELGISVGTVKSRLARGRAALAPLLGVEVEHA
jgi:RNA polymerase sigma-70 factor, ECF subfamily